MRSVRQRLQDIIEAIDNVQRYAVRGRDAYFDDELIRVWIIHHLQIAGEASRALSAEFRQQHSHVPWRELINVRNLFAHVYFGVAMYRVWDLVDKKVVGIRDQIQVLIDDLDSQARP